MPRGGVIRKTDYAKRAKRFRAIFTKFGDLIEPKMIALHAPGGILEKVKWEEPTEEALLKLRSMLAWEIKTGMLERKDRELEISVLAMLVWFMRLEKERRDQIMEVWS